MRCPASEKLEIIGLVERSHLPVRRTLDKLGIPATTFYRWYDRYRAFGEAGLEDRTGGPGRIWNRIPDDVRRQIVDLALDEPELSPRELAVTFTDTKDYFRLGRVRLPPAQGPRPDHQPGLRRHQGVLPLKTEPDFARVLASVWKGLGWLGSVIRTKIY